MNIGVAKEIKSDEYRVALTPAGALELVQSGHSVVVERGAGEGSAFPDAEYERVGARIGSVEEVWAESELVLKVKEPLAEEYPRLREGQILFTYLHLAASDELTRALMESGAACVAYETVETDDRALPLLAPMSEIAGRLAAQAGATFLEKPLGGRGLLLGGVPGVAPGEVVVIGGGMVGYNAAVIALGLGAKVTILERSIDRMRHLEEVLGARVTLLMSSSLQIQESVAAADVVDRRRPDPRRAGAEADHAGDGLRDEGGLGDRRRRDRPGWVRRDVASRRHTRSRSSSSTASSTTASRTCRAPSRSRRRRR